MLNHTFPAGIAVDDQFCNREQERLELKESFLNTEHRVVIAPRRYGKTSLINQAIQENDLANIQVDLFLATDDVFVKKAIEDGIRKLLATLLPKTQKIRQKIISLIQSLHPKLILNMFGQTVQLSTTQTPDRSIIDLLMSLDTIAKEANKRIVVVFDEFQQVGLIKEAQVIEGSIRHAVERSQYVTYIFSGSHRHLLNQMFSDKNRPLYHLCNLMTIDRISKEVYKPFLNKHFKKRWGVSLKEDCLNEILDLTECHAYYVNALCRQILKLAKPPQLAEIQQAWHNYVFRQAAWIASDLDQLSINQRSILAAIAYEPTDEPLGREFNNKIKATASSTRISLQYLTKRDFVYQDNKGYYRVLDPAIATYVRQIRHFDFVE